MKKVTEVLLQKQRHAKYPFKWQPWCWTYFFPSRSWATCLKSHLLVLLLFPMFASIYIAIFKAGSNSLGKTLRYCIPSLTKSHARTDSLINVRKQLFSSHFILDFNTVCTKVTFIRFFFVLLCRYRSKSHFHWNVTFSFHLFGLVELLLPKRLRQIIGVSHYSGEASLQAGHKEKRSYTNQNWWRVYLRQWLFWVLCIVAHMILKIISWHRYYFHPLYIGEEQTCPKLPSTRTRIQTQAVWCHSQLSQPL